MKSMICDRLRRKAAVAILPAAALCALLPGCSWRVPADTARLHSGMRSQKALAEAVLDAVRRHDLQALAGLALSREEFRQSVWPELPVSNPKTNVSVDFVWNELHFRSMSRMHGIFSELGGKRIHLVRVAHRGKVTEYATHRAYPDMEVRIRDEAGKEIEYPLFGTLIEMDGVWKVYSYAPTD